MLGHDMKAMNSKCSCRCDLSKMANSRASSGSGLQKAGPTFSFSARELFFVVVILWLAYLNVGSITGGLGGDDTYDAEVTTPAYLQAAFEALRGRWGLASARAPQSGLANVDHGRGHYPLAAAG